MTAILKVDTIQDTSGNNIINESSDTITIGASGDTISIPSGATIANSGTATGFGKVLQVVTGTSESSGTTTSTSFSSTGLAASITPSATSSKIFVTCSFTASKNSDANDTDWAYFSIFRDSTNIGGSNGRGIVGHYLYTADTADNHFPVNMVILDSPSSTSSLSYSVQYAGSGSNDTIAFNNRSMKTSIVLMEIAG
jgi:hypothetical protein|tara:strand:+ start:1076 stop:1663 length:588 start_codon:yes stop_codon:yes gene_type:complete